MHSEQISGTNEMMNSWVIRAFRHSIAERKVYRAFTVVFEIMWFYLFRVKMLRLITVGKTKLKKKRRRINLRHKGIHLTKQAKGPSNSGIELQHINITNDCDRRNNLPLINMLWPKLYYVVVFFDILVLLKIKTFVAHFASKTD